MNYDKDISEFLISAERFKQLFDAIQDAYKSIERIDKILGTATKESVNQHKIEHYRCYK